MKTTTLELIALVNKACGPTAVRLWERWQDESKYEDIKEYGKVLATLLPANVKFVRMYAKPHFQFTYRAIGKGEQPHCYLRVTGTESTVTVTGRIC